MRTKTILMLNWIVWIRAVWLNWIAWNVVKIKPCTCSFQYVSRLFFVQAFKIVVDSLKFTNEMNVKWFQVLLCITNNSIKHEWFVYTQLNDKTVLFQTIQFNMLFVCTQLKCQTGLFDP